MKRKEINNLAKKIAKAEMIIQQSNDKNEINKAKNEIYNLSGSIKSLEDMMALDEAISDILMKNI